MIVETKRRQDVCAGPNVLRLKQCCEDATTYDFVYGNRLRPRDRAGL